MTGTAPTAAAGVAGAAAALLLTLAACRTSSAPAPTESSSGAAPSASTTTTTPRPSIEPGTIPGAGLFTVGTDIQPGTYVSDTAPTVTCYAARLTTKDAPDPLIANYVTTGRSVVTIEKTDRYFETHDCATWRKR